MFTCHPFRRTSSRVCLPRTHAHTHIRIHVSYSDAGTFCVQRKHALVHAIKLAHSPHTSLKRLAAMNIARFFKAFPDLEEDAINAIYDLCEDQDPNVRSSPHALFLSNPEKSPSHPHPPFSQIRIEGYKAIVGMSEEQPRWVERNVDVLAQLLQSGGSLIPPWFSRSSSRREIIAY
jgi:Apoptosis inhibitory protein 5 (API5)